MVLSTKIFATIVSGTFSDALWKNLQEQIQNSNKRSQEVSVFLERLYQNKKKHEDAHEPLKTNQKIVLFEYFLKILTMEEFLFGNDWNSVIFEEFEEFDATIQNLITEISLILMKVDETFRSRIFQNAILKSNQNDLYDFK
jgi:hypothetical protein